MLTASDRISAENLAYKTLHLNLGLDKNIGKGLNMAIQAHFHTPGHSHKPGGAGDGEEKKVSLTLSKARPMSVR